MTATLRPDHEIPDMLELLSQEVIAEPEEKKNIAIVPVCQSIASIVRSRATIPRARCSRICPTPSHHADLRSTSDPDGPPAIFRNMALTENKKKAKKGNGGGAGRPKNVAEADAVFPVSVLLEGVPLTFEDLTKHADEESAAVAATATRYKLDSVPTDRDSFEWKSLAAASWNSLSLHRRWTHNILGYAPYPTGPEFYKRWSLGGLPPHPELDIFGRYGQNNSIEYLVRMKTMLDYPIAPFLFLLSSIAEVAWYTINDRWLIYAPSVIGTYKVIYPQFIIVTVPRRESSLTTAACDDDDDVDGGSHALNRCPLGHLVPTGTKTCQCQTEKLSDLALCYPTSDFICIVIHRVIAAFSDLSSMHTAEKERAALDSWIEYMLERNHRLRMTTSHWVECPINKNRECYMDEITAGIKDRKERKHCLPKVSMVHHFKQRTFPIFRQRLTLPSLQQCLFADYALVVVITHLLAKPYDPVLPVLAKHGVDDAETRRLFLASTEPLAKIAAMWLGVRDTTKIKTQNLRQHKGGKAEPEAKEEKKKATNNKKKKQKKPKGRAKRSSMVSVSTPMPQPETPMTAAAGVSPMLGDVAEYDDDHVSGLVADGFLEPVTLPPPPPPPQEEDPENEDEAMATCFRATNELAGWAYRSSHFDVTDTPSVDISALDEVLAMKHGDSNKRVFTIGDTPMRPPVIVLPQPPPLRIDDAATAADDSESLIIQEWTKLDPLRARFTYTDRNGKLRLSPPVCMTRDPLLITIHECDEVGPATVSYSYIRYCLAYYQNILPPKGAQSAELKHCDRMHWPIVHMSSTEFKSGEFGRKWQYVPFSKQYAMAVKTRQSGVHNDMPLNYRTYLSDCNRIYETREDDTWLVSLWYALSCTAKYEEDVVASLCHVQSIVSIDDVDKIRDLQRKLYTGSIRYDRYQSKQQQDVATTAATKRIKSSSDALKTAKVNLRNLLDAAEPRSLSFKESVSSLGYGLMRESHLKDRRRGEEEYQYLWYEDKTPGDSKMWPIPLTLDDPVRIEFEEIYIRMASGLYKSQDLRLLSTKGCMYHVVLPSGETQSVCDHIHFLAQRWFDVAWSPLLRLIHIFCIQPMVRCTIADKDSTEVEWVDIKEEDTPLRGLIEKHTDSFNKLINTCISSPSKLDALIAEIGSMATKQLGSSAHALRMMATLLEESKHKPAARLRRRVIRTLETSPSPLPSSSSSAVAAIPRTRIMLRVSVEIDALVTRCKQAVDSARYPEDTIREFVFLLARSYDALLMDVECVSPAVLDAVEYTALPSAKDRLVSILDAPHYDSRYTSTKIKCISALVALIYPNWIRNMNPDSEQSVVVHLLFRDYGNSIHPSESHGMPFDDTPLEPLPIV
jgi:hypothetical protein